VLRGEDANLLSLGAVDFGIIVDSAVIMMENIYRNFQSTPAHRQTLLHHLSEGYWGPDPTSVAGNTTASQRWTERLRIIFVSALQVDKAVFFTAAITVTAFVPLFTMQGVEGQIFGPMARTYGYALAGALLSTFTVTPILASLLLPRHIEEVETVIVRGLRATYTPVLRWALGHLKIAVIIGVVFLALSFAAASRLGSEFLPALEEGNLWIRAAMPPTISLDAGTEATGKMREILLRHPEVLSVVSQHGRPDNGSDASPFSNVELFAPLKPFDEWPADLTKEMLTEELQKEFNDELPGIGFNFSQYIQDNIEEALSGVKGANSVKIVGPNLEILEQLATKVMAEMAKVQGVADLGIFHLLGQPNLNIKVDREKAARYGLNTGDVNTVVQAALGGTNATTVLEGDRQFSLAVRLDPKYRASIDGVRAVKVAYSTPSGINAYVPLSEIADITLDTGASFIYRERSQRYIPIKFSVRGRDLGGTVAEAQERVARAVKLPNGFQILWAGEFDDLQNAKQRLMVVVPITLLLILVLLYGLFNSLRDSLLAVAGIPFAIGGGLIALYLAGLDFSVSAAIGFISLFGVAVMDGILNITYFRELRLQGMDIAEAVFHGAEQRMRPMLMTALSAGVGLFPAAISHGIGSQVQRPLATVVVGGMFIGPLLLLVVAPALRKIFLSRDRAPVSEGGGEAVAAAEGGLES
jgi:cobalt-zinc-cadmium resistance protein CzcA